ncbi:MAG: response regulator [Candidatus Obscuribacterales bacterium]|nr:response regulator [Steroidobacteraceae bacterium]
MKGNEFLLGIIGLSRVERMTVTSVCSLTQSRPRGYAVLPPERSQDADILLIDADDVAARNSWRESPLFKQGRPALMISRDANALGTASYSLPRANFASRLVKILDQIAIREFHYFPNAVVGDNVAIDPALNVPAARSMRFDPNRPRVLVVDDALVVRTQMRSLLALHHLDAELVPDAERALALMQLNRYAMVFLDVVMAGMDGYTACRRMKHIDRHVPIIMLTGRDSAFDKVRGVMAGCNRYLTKPIAVEALSKVLEEYLAKELPAVQLA